MNRDVLWLALAFMLMFEGITPLVAPSAWRHMLEKMMQMPDSVIRLAGAVIVLLGLALYWLMKTQA